MSTMRSGRQLLFLTICALGAAFIGAGVFGETAGQPPDKQKVVNRPKVAVRQHNIEQAHLQVLNGQKAIPFKKIELAEFQTKGKKLTADTVMTLPNKKTIKVGDYLISLNKLEAKLNEHGYSVRQKLPKGGVHMGMKARPSAEMLKKQKELLTKACHKVPADKEAIAKAHLASRTKANHAAMLKDDQANREKIRKWQDAQMDHLKKVDVKKLTPAERTLYTHVHDLVKKRTAVPAVAKQEKYLVAVASMKQDIQRASQLLNNTKFDNEDLSLLIPIVLKSCAYEEAHSWNWSLGSPDVAEAYVNGSLEVHAFAWTFGSAFHTRGSLQAGGYALSSQFTVLDALVDLSSSNGLLSTNMHAQIYAKFFGNDIFTPIDTTSSDFNNYPGSGTYSFDVPIVEGDVVIVVVPFHYAIGLRGSVFCDDFLGLTPTFAYNSQIVEVSSTLYASGAVDGLVVRAGVRGSLNLIDEKLTLCGFERLVFDPGNPHLHGEFWVKDRLSLLGGEVDLYAEYWAPDHWYTPWDGSWHDIGSINLFSWDGLTPIDGYLYGPDTWDVPLK